MEKIIIPEPGYYNSYLDEKNFFDWLESIPGVEDVTGVYAGLEVTLAGVPSESDLRDLIALMTRYDLDLRCLQVPCTPENEKWLKNKSAYWYERMFGGEHT